MLLALDTSTAGAGAAVVDETGQVLATVSVSDPRRHAESLAPCLTQAVAEAGAGLEDLSALAVGVGPGPFTGLRVGLVTALVLARVRDLPVHGLCSLDALAAQALDQSPGCADGSGFLVATDARRKEVYWSRYAVRAGAAYRVEGPAVARAADLAPELRGLPCVGRGAEMYGESLHQSPGPLDVSAGWVGRQVHDGLAGDRSVQLLPVRPLYLRRPDTATPAPPKQVRP